MVSQGQHGRFSLFSVPILCIISIATLDTADQQLLSSSFGVLEKILHFDVKSLGLFSFFSNASYALSMPLWSFLFHRLGSSYIPKFLSGSCLLWGFSTLGMTHYSRSYYSQIAFRCLNGFALASMLPLSQTVLTSLVPPQMKGRAFGLLGACEKLGGMLASTSVIYVSNSESYWHLPYYVLGMSSLGMALLVYSVLDSSIFSPHLPKQSNNVENFSSQLLKTPKLTIREMTERIIQIPAFVCLVAQGVFGGTPWNMMSFLTLLFQWRQFTRFQMVILQCTTGISGMVGGYIGGYLGDYYALQYPKRGRIYVALVSISMHIPTFGFYLYSTQMNHFGITLLGANMFFLSCTWTPSAAIRPICSELARDPSERAQIVSLWMVLEKLSGAILGAPLVGYLTEHLLNQNELNKDAIGEEQKAISLVKALFGLSSLFWTLSGLCWLIMAIKFDATATSLKSRVDKTAGLVKTI